MLGILRLKCDLCINGPSLTSQERTSSGPQRTALEKPAAKIITGYLVKDQRTSH